MLSSIRVPDDERKGRRLGDETKGRIADLASGWTVEGASPPAPEVPGDREASGRARNATRRKAKTLPPPPPGSPERKALEDKVDELKRIAGPSEPSELLDATDVPDPTDPTDRDPIGQLEDRSPGKPSKRPPPIPPARPRTPTPGGRPRAKRDASHLDLGAVPEADKTKENRGAVGITQDKNASLTANAASGTIGGDTPSPVFDRAAIAAGQAAGQAAGRKGALAKAGERMSPTSAAGGSGPTSAAAAGTSGPTLARGTPTPGTTGDKLPRPDPAQAAPALLTGAPSAGPPDGRARDAVPETIEPGAARKDRSRPVARPPGPEARPPEPGQLAVPVGEFEPGATVLEEDKLRIAHAQATIKRDAANALLGVAEPAPAKSKPLATSVVLQDIARRGTALRDASGSSTGRFERGDATGPDADDRDDATALSAPSARHAPAGTLRSPAALPRKRGLLGDVRYIATVVFGLRAVKREHAEIEARQATRQQSRRHHLITLGRAAVTSEGFFHPELAPAREQLASIEDERSQHAGHVVAADAELTRVRRDREAKAKQFVVDLAALDAELAAHIRQLEPLEKEASGIRRRAADLHEALRRIDGKIAATEAALAPGRTAKLDPAAVQAELATLRAERKAIQRDEPVLAGEHDALNPRIAALEAARAEARRRRAELETTEHDDQRRVEELLAAIGAKRKVVDRAAADAEALRDKILFRLGERLYVDRPDDLFAQLAPIDDIDVEIGSDDRRIMEIREIRSSVDKLKIARGIALLTLLIGAIGAVVTWLVVSGYL
jgi:hypothetical protein